jgi:hypothetical protein
MDGQLYPLNEPPPPGATGDDPTTFAPFGVGNIDTVRLQTPNLRW